MANILKYGRDYVWSYFAAKRLNGAFKDVSAYCMFIGHGRSGHTLLGTLLNAHPDAVIGTELDALAFVKRGISRDQLFALILKNDQYYAKQKYFSHGNSFDVPNQWQGRYRTLKVIGDRKAGVSTLRLRESPELLPKLRRVIGLPLRVVHLLRNPYDIIGSIVRQTGTPLTESLVAKHFSMTDTNARLLEECDPSEIRTVRHEDIVAQPKERLRELIEFLELKSDNAYLCDCAGIVFESPSKTRTKVQWTDSLRQQVQENIEKYPFLKGYTFES